MDTEQLAVNAIKALAMDAVQKAGSGHPGAPMGMADMAVVLWSKYLTVDPGDPTWPDRDRFVLSNGHASMLLYALLHLCGFPVTMDDLRHFRQWGSPTAGHPERHPGLGIETTTGPLGQGFGHGVGMAIAEAHLRATLGADLVDHRTYAFVSDGDLMEGVASEAASLAGHLGLGRLVYLYDDNHITIEGTTALAFTEDARRRFEAYGWHTQHVEGHDREGVDRAIAAALAEEDRPSLILAHTHIADGAPNLHDSAEAHGKPLGVAEVAATKAAMGWPVDEPFFVPDEVYDFFSGAMERGRIARQRWQSRADRVLAADPELAARWKAFFEHAPVSVEDLDFDPEKKLATRQASGRVINLLADRVPGLVGGAADLAPSTNTMIEGSPAFARGEQAGRNFHFGVREHAMGSIANGIALHGGLRPYAATFLVFSDYMRPAVRLSALMQVPVIWIWTHDSVFLGEDGPTHQPIEHLMALRAIPGLWVVRPADGRETAQAWQLALNRTEGPTAIVLTRQGVPQLAGVGEVERGGYVLRDGDDVVMVATGSEVHVAADAAEILAGRGVSVRVVSLPCWEAFANQDEGYRRQVLGSGIPRVSIEAGVTLGWERIIGSDGLAIGIDHFGASAPAEVIAAELGFAPESIAGRISDWLATR